MAYPKLQSWLYVQLTLKDKATGATTDYYFSNRAIIDNANVGRYIPIIKSVGAFGVKLGKYLPETKATTVTLDDSPESFGFERRVSDLFERLTPLDQTIKLYCALSDFNDLDATSDFTLAWTGRVVGWKVSGGANPTCALQVQAVGIPARIIGRQISSSEFPSAPSTSLGQYLPLVVGQSVEVAPVRLSADNATSPEYGYALTFGTTYPNAGVQIYYVRDVDGKYKEVKSAATTTTKLFDTTSGAVSFVTGNDEVSRTRDLGVISSTRYVLTQAEVIYVQGIVGQTGTMSLEIWEKNPDGKPWRRVGSAVRDKADFTWGAGNVTVPFVFADPVPLTSSYGYMAYVTQTTKTGGSATPSHQGGSPTYDSYTIDTTSGTGTSQAWTKHVFQQHDFAAAFYGVVLTDTPAPASGRVDTNGFGYSYVTATQKSAVGAIPNPDITRLDYVFNVNGLKDDGSGTVTGVANQLLESPQHVVELLDKEWNGSSWTGGKFDWSKYSSTHSAVNSSTDAYYRKIAGRTDGRAYLGDVYSSICRSSACRISLFNGASNQLGFWAWGKTGASVATISDEEATITAIDQLGLDTVINRAEIIYSKLLTGFSSVAASSAADIQQFAGSLSFYNGSSALATGLTALSESIYGRRYLQDNSFEYLNDSSSALRIAEFLARVYQHPHIYVELEVPFFKYQAVDMLDVVTIVHPDLPAYFGTTSKAQKPYYSGSEVDILQGHYWKRANAYRALVEGRDIYFDAQNIPLMRLSCRLLLNSNDPT